MIKKILEFLVVITIVFIILEIILIFKETFVAILLIFLILQITKNFYD